MKVWQLDGGFGVDNLSLADRPEPEPGPGQVKVRITAASLNFRDTVIVAGAYSATQPLPLIPLSDGAGEVVAVGEGVTRFKPGDRVTPTFHQGWISGEPTFERLSHALGAGELDGVAAPYRVFSQDGLCHTPAYLTDEEAACLPCAALTAWAALVSDTGTAPGETVLIQGTGGVSIFALQMAKAMGVRAIVTSSSDDKLERARALGADDTVNSRTTPEWHKAARDLTGGRGVDHVVEVGGAGTMERSLKSVRIGGRISVIGVLSGGGAAELSIIHMLMGHVRLQGITVASRDDHEAMGRFLELTGLKPVIDRSFAFEELPQALAHMASGSHFGKIVVRVGD